MKRKPYKPLPKTLEDMCEMRARIPPYVMFMAAKDEIEEALAGGWRVSEIWEAMKNEGRIQCVYGTFARYIRVHIQKRPVNKQNEKTKQWARSRGVISNGQ